MRWRTECRLLSIGLALAMAPACFGEPPPANVSTTSDGGTGDTTGACPLGTDGCDCLSDGSCDAGLACTASGKCIADDCTPGEDGCTCNEGLCLGDLECNADDICGPPGASTSGATSDGGTSGGPDVCAPMASDGACAMCAKESCCGALRDCVDEPECACLATCSEAQSGDTSTCASECGVESLPAGFETLVGCVAEQCPVCEPSCNVPATAPACTMCAAEFCCPELDACLDEVECQCAEACMASGEKLPEQCVADCGAIGSPQLLDLQACAAANQCFGGSETPCYGP